MKRQRVEMGGRGSDERSKRNRGKDIGPTKSYQSETEGESSTVQGERKRREERRGEERREERSEE